MGRTVGEGSVGEHWVVELAPHSATGDGADDAAAGSHTRAVFVGFDSAWADKAEAPGAICSVHFEGAGFTDFRPPELVGFDLALDYIRAIRRPGVPTIVAIDQPTIVPNATGMRPAEKVAGSLISWMGGGVQPANTGRPLFGCAAPVTLFLRQLGAGEDPEMARTAAQGIHLIEVFPALALASLEPAFFGLRKGPRYNPDRRNTFRMEDWRAVVETAMREATNLGCTPLVSWIEEMRATASPKKEHQDRLDSALCLLIAIRWRLGKREQSVAVGDLKNGYIIAPVSEPVFKRLREVAAKRGVPIDDLGELAACL
jgi:predicted RNase H-like nuclease